MGRELGVRYVLEGSVRKAGQRVRITGQLIDAVTGTHLWADRFDGSLEDVFDLQDQVAASVVGIIGTAVQDAEVERALRKRPESLDAYDLYLRSLPAINAYTREGFVEVEGLRYLVAPRGDTQWVRNLRVAGEAELRVGQRREHIQAREIDNACKPPVLRAYLRRWKRETGKFFGVDDRASDEDLTRIAPDHPVFQIT